MMELVSGSNPILTSPCADFDFENPPFDPIEFSKELVKFMIDRNGLGLSANQVGTPYRVFAMRGAPQNFVCFNPKIISVGEEEIVLEEGCLSFLGLIVKVKRPKNIRVRFNTPNGDVRTEVFHGMSARVFQHEYDHLGGVLFYNRANKFHRDQAFRQARKVA
jgi:peptide deformylase